MRERSGINTWVGLARLPWALWSSGFDFMFRVMLPPGLYERYCDATTEFSGCGQQGRERSRSTSETEADAAGVTL